MQGLRLIILGLVCWGPWVSAAKSEVSTSADDAISFAGSLAEILQSRCVGCHGGDAPRSGLNLQTFAGLIQGGMSGPIVKSKDGAGSLLVRKLRGTADGQRMPAGREPLADDVIQRFENWIDAGAENDGGDASLPLDRVVASYRAKHLSVEELSVQQQEGALAKWRLAFPGQSPQVVTMDPFLIMGNGPVDELKSVGEQALATYEKLRKGVRLPDGTPILKGRLTIFVLRRRYDYGEFGTMVEKRQLPISMQGHWRVDDTSYIVVGPGLSLELPLTHFLASVMIRNWSDTPTWFAEGAGLALAERLHRKDPQVRSWGNAAREGGLNAKDAGQILKGELPPEVAPYVQWAFVKTLFQDSRRATRFLLSLHEGKPFEADFASNFGGSPEAVCTAWLNSWLKKKP